MGLFAKVPISVIRNHNISPMAKVLFAEIIFRCNGKGSAFGKVSGWAEAIGCTTKHLKKLRAELVRNGLITDNPRGKITEFSIVSDEPTGSPEDYLINLGDVPDEPTGSPDAVLINLQVNHIKREEDKRDNTNRQGARELWDIYPKKENEFGAFLAYKEKKAEGKLPGNEILISAIKAQIEGKWRDIEHRYIPTMATWITKERWKDEIPIEQNNRKTDPLAPVFKALGPIRRNTE